MNTGMRAERSRRRWVPTLVLLALGAALPCVATAAGAAPESVTVPLQIVRPSRDEIKIGIELRLGGGKRRLYELDTGASGLYAAYNEKWWPAYEPVSDHVIRQSYGSGIEYEAQRVMTTVAIPSDRGDVEAEVEVARITDAFGGPLGPRRDSRWLDKVARGVPPLYGHFFGNFGSDLRSNNGLFAVLPQLPGNLSSGFIVQLGCGGGRDPSLVIGLTARSRARFSTLLPMQPDDEQRTFPHSGLPTYSQRLIAARFDFSRRGVEAGFDADAILDTGASTTEIHELDQVTLPAALVDARYGVVKPLTRFEVTSNGVGPAGDFRLALASGLSVGRNRLDLTASTGDDGYVNLGLIPFFRHDVMFDVQNGVVGFAPCRRSGGAVAAR